MHVEVQDEGHLSVPGPKRRGNWRHWTRVDAERWKEKFLAKTPLVEIAAQEGADPGTVSSWLHKLGVQVKQGQHRVVHLPLKYPEPFVNLVLKGPDEVMKLLTERVWGINFSDIGVEQLRKFCEFARSHTAGKGVEEMANELAMHRTSIAAWREGKDQPYLIRVAQTISSPPRKKWKWLPLTISSGGNSFGDWIEVPDAIESHDDITEVIAQLRPVETMYTRGAGFDLDAATLDSMRSDLFAYLLGFMLGDASKLGGKEERFTSVNIDLQLSLKHESNSRLGEFLCLCLNSLGLRMNRTADKQPSGDSKLAQIPTGAFRWSSERSPLLAWAFSVAMEMTWGTNTSHSPVSMEWLFSAPTRFRLRFIQALADSDATVKPYEVIITSVPNAEFTTRLLNSLGMKTAHTIKEYERPLRTMLSRREAMTLPIFNEFVRGYRFEKLTARFGR